MKVFIQRRLTQFGLCGVILGAASVVLVLLQFSIFFEPQDQIFDTTIDEVATSLKQSAMQALQGETSPESTSSSVDKAQIVAFIGLCIAGVAVALGGLGLYQKEPFKLPCMAIGLGFTAIFVHYFLLLALMVFLLTLIPLMIGGSGLDISL